MELGSKLAKIKKAAQQLRLSSLKQRNQVLLLAANSLLARQEEILTANKNDLVSVASTATPAFKDRLTLTPERLKQMSISLKQVAALPDPLAEKLPTKTLKNRLKLRQVRAPLGVIFMIFESRPNVAIEAFSMGFKSGNAMILRGGKESLKTVGVLFDILLQSIKSTGLSTDTLWGIDNPDRELVSKLLTQKDFIDVVVPRGGDGLIQFVVDNSKIPIIKNDRGLCHVYAHEDANLQMATKIVVNAKTQRPGVCNSMETLLVHEKIAAKLLPLVVLQMKVFGVQWWGCEKTRQILKDTLTVQLANDVSYSTEYLDQKVNCKVVANLDEALAHIEKFGSRHSEAIVTKSKRTAARFQREVDAAVTYWNASTRFTDGFEFGLGGELGISTQKLHVRGPVGLKALTNVRWVVDGKGQIR